MGLLDPKLDKPRTFELLRAKGAVKAVLKFDGGNDEGNVESIMLTLANGSETEMEPWYCGGYTFGENGNYVPLSEPENDDQELADLLEGPINERFGSWGGVPHTYGTLTWDVETGKAVFSYEQETYQTYGGEV